MVKLLHFSFLFIVIMLTACSAAVGPSIEGDEDEIKFEEIQDVDYRAEGPSSQGPEAPPYVQ